MSLLTACKRHNHIYHNSCIAPTKKKKIYLFTLVIIIGAKNTVIHFECKIKFD